MQVSKTTVKQLIDGDRQYVIPLFQRAYSWKKEQWEIFWDDLTDLLDRRGSSSDRSERSHFLGNIVTMPISLGPSESVTKYMLIDGQQRLTTIFILLSVLRDIANNTEQKEVAQKIHEKLLVNNLEKGTEFFKLLPTQDDREAYNAIVGEKKFVDESLLTQSYKFFQKKVKSSELDLDTIKQAVINKLTVVSIALEGNDDNPYLVFESLNGKGQPLTQADLIRNLLFMYVYQDEQKEIYDQYWYPMESKLKELLSEYLRHFLLKDNAGVKKDDIYFLIKQKFTSSKQDNRTAHGVSVDFLKELNKFAGYYHQLIDPDMEKNSSIRRSLKRLNRTEVTVIYPFLLHCYDKYNDKKLTTQEFLDLLNVLENFLVRRFVCNTPSVGLNRVFSALCQHIQGENIVIVQYVKDFLQTKHYPTDEEFKRDLEKSRLYAPGERLEKSKFILESLEESYKNKEIVSFDVLTIEHIMPQKLSDEWEAYLGDELKSTHNDLLHTLGNLTLTADNAKLSNNSFDKKKKHLYEQSNLEINKYFRDKSDWRREDIEKRAEYLAGIALKIWPYFGNSDEKRSNVNDTKPKK
jgi:uncharacterized protein with ParB-like and HNH nuclease domain